MIQEVFRQALFHSEPKVLNRRLLPLSLGHLYYLQAANSPYFYGREKVFGDLILAVAICTRTWEQMECFVGASSGDDEFSAWGHECQQLDIAAESAVLEKYIADSCVFPVRFQDVSKPSKRCLHPWPLYLATSIMDMVGESRAWNMPVALAISYASARAEWKNGDESLRDEVIDEIKARVKEQGAANG